MSFDPYAPYGRVVESAVRVVTWNVWGRYGPDWQTRQAALEAVLAEVRPEVICLVESWRQGESSQPAQIAGRLGLPHHHFVGDWAQEDWVSGIGVACPPGRAAVASGTRSTVSCSESVRPTRRRYPITTACWRISVIEQRARLDGRTSHSERAR